MTCCFHPGFNDTFPFLKPLSNLFITYKSVLDLLKSSNGSWNQQLYIPNFLEMIKFPGNSKLPSLDGCEILHHLIDVSHSLGFLSSSPSSTPLGHYPGGWSALTSCGARNAAACPEPGPRPPGAKSTGEIDSLFSWQFNEQICRAAKLWDLSWSKMSDWNWLNIIVSSSLSLSKTWTIMKIPSAWGFLLASPYACHALIPCHGCTLTNCSQVMDWH